MGERRTRSDVAFDHILGRLFDGSLRTGDQVDLDEITRVLGCSKIPVREAVIRLERDGVLEIRYRRDVVVRPFEQATITEHYEMYGVLAGLASARVAAARDPEVVARLSALFRTLEETDDGGTFYRVGLAFRQVIDEAGSNVRLHALLTNFSSFVPGSFRLVVDESRLTRLRAPIRFELAAIRRGDPDEARCAAEANLRVAGEEIVRVLRQRGVF